MNTIARQEKYTFAAIFLLLLGFLWISIGIYHETAWIAALDEFGNAFFRLPLQAETTALFFTFTQLGNRPNLALVTLLVVALLWYKKEKVSALWLFLSMVGAGTLMPFLLKQIFRRPRPTDGLMTRTGYSYPSGHATGVLILYGLLLLLATLHMQKSLLRQLLVCLFACVILIISWSRIHLGVHFLSDIIGSTFLSLAFLVFAYWGLHRGGRTKHEKD